MDPYEAIRAGILEGEIPEPFWTVTTTDTTQSWTVYALTGGVVVVDWGDGQQQWHTGTGGVVVLTHTYASSGTYMIKWYNPQDKLRYLFGNTNGLTGTMQPMSAVSLGSLQVSANSFTGTIPSLTTLSSLSVIYLFSNGFTGYTPSSIASSLVNFLANNNALTQTAVDQILTDFTTGAGARPAAGTINLSGGTNAAPTPAVLAACVSALPGWTISTN